MQLHKADKLEAPARVLELDPPATLKRLGLGPEDGFCDIGAGSGIFAFAAAKMTSGAVYAVDVSEELLALLRERAAQPGRENVRVTEGAERVPSGECALCLLCTVLHELYDIPAMLREARRVLRPGGVLAVIEFHKRSTPMGPAVERRLDADTVGRLAAAEGFVKREEFVLGENLYCLTLGRD